MMRPARATAAIAALVVFAAAFLWFRDWAAKRPHLEPRGGLWFPVEVVNDVPQFAQSDPRWAADKLGSTPATLADEGCAVASAAMVLASYGADLDPGRLNAHLRDNGGFTGNGWLYWEKACTYPPAVAEHIYEDEASHFLIDWNLLRGNPVIVRLRYPDGITHFVVIVGKTGSDYLVRDPGKRHRDGIYRLSEFGSPIEALRYYRKLPPAGTS